MSDGLSTTSLADTARSEHSEPALALARSTQGKMPTRTLSLAAAPGPAATVVPLFVVDAQSETDANTAGDVHTDWPGALQMIRDVGAQVRRERDLARELMKQSHAIAQRSIAQAEEAEKRAGAAEMRAAEASLRADYAEERARLAEKQALRADEQAQAARAGEEEAQLWLRRLYKSLRSEFDVIADISV